MVSLDLMKSSEDRIAGDQPKYKKSSKIATFFKKIIIRLWADEDYQDYECFLMLETIFETLIAAYIMYIRVHTFESIEHNNTHLLYSSTTTSLFKSRSKETFCVEHFVLS